MEFKERMRMVLALCAVFALTVGVAIASAGGGGGSQKKLCFQGGWQMVYGTDGTTFTSQRACVSYVGGGGTLTTTPPIVRFGSRIDCESVGGTYTTTDPVWKCLGASFPSYADMGLATERLHADCLAEAASATGFYATLIGGVSQGPWSGDFYCAGSN